MSGLEKVFIGLIAGAGIIGAGLVAMTLLLVAVKILIAGIC
jgi:hypothetical protein